METPFSSNLLEGHATGDGQGVGCVRLVESAGEQAQQRFSRTGQNAADIGRRVSEADVLAEDQAKDPVRFGSFHAQGGLDTFEHLRFGQESEHKAERTAELLENGGRLLDGEGRMRVKGNSDGVQRGPCCSRSGCRCCSGATRWAAANRATTTPAARTTRSPGSTGPSRTATFSGSPNAWWT